MGLYYRWRAHLLNDDSGHSLFGHAEGKQDRQDLMESNQKLKGDLHLLALRASPHAMRDERGIGLALSPHERANANQVAVALAQAGRPLSPWEQWVLEIFRNKGGDRSAGRGEDDLLHHYIHDSFAGFYMAGAVTRFDQEEAFIEMCRKLARGGRLNAFDQRLYDLNPELSCEKAEEFRKAAEEGKESPADLNFPLMTDDDAAHLRVSVIGLVTRTRREGGGYLRRRWVY